ncbi:MAG TPA: hypothetical protein VH275_06070 [Solirubrobacterales bacterium]|nr:hypothetical protein [Solirubrobacterales bacterium]
MLRALVLLLAASLLTLVLSLAPAGAHPTFRVECDQPHLLHLHRFEDGSARVECGDRTLVRISVPG